MNTYKRVFADCVSASLGRILSSTDNDQCRFLMYHAVGTTVSGDVYGLYNLSREGFKAQIDRLAELRQAGLCTVQALYEGARDYSGVVITFDDGYLDTLKTAAPILLEHGLPFSVFVAPGLLLGGERSYLSLADLKELASLPGVTIGAHGFSHERLTACDDMSLATELKTSRLWLENILGKAVDTMSYPHGAVDQRVCAAVEQAGFKLAATSKFGAYGPGDHPLMVQRTDIWAQDSVRRFESKLSGAWDWFGRLS